MRRVIITNYEVFEAKDFARDFCKELEKYLESREHKKVMVTSLVFGDNELSITVSNSKGKASFHLGKVDEVKYDSALTQSQIVKLFEEKVGK